jgi:beta-galactosidase
VGFLAVFCCKGLDAQLRFYPVRDQMLTESLDGTWKIKMIAGQVIPDSLSNWLDLSYDTQNWQDILVPGNLETQGLKMPEYGADLSDYTGLYRRKFDYNPSWKGRHVILRLDGVNFSYTIYLNGHKVGDWGSSFNLCQFDITPYLNKGGKNLLCIQVSTRSLPTQPDNTWQFDTNDDWSLSGISRDVTLFTLDTVYLKDVTFTTDILENKDADVKVDVQVDRFKPTHTQNYQVEVSLVDPLNNHVIDFRKACTFNKDTIHFKGKLKTPSLWTAETPNLYRLEVNIIGPTGQVIQRTHQKVGIRSVRVDGYNLKVNNVPIKLHGVCLSEINPKNGRALTYKQRRQQLQMMKAAGINFIRTAHYPFSPDFYDLTDEMGFYICDEVPFGFGDHNLKDETYLPQLITRARATISRDKNHPAVIIWSIGNENPYTPIVEKVIQYVKQKDPSRPRGLPQRGSDYLRYQGRQSPNVDIYMPHYLDVTSLNKSLQKTDKPLILTEYAHSLGLAMDEFEQQYANILKQPRIIGGSIWCWTDQAMLISRPPNGLESVNRFNEKVNHPNLKQTQVMEGIQIDQHHYLDNNGNNGADGIVYGDGYPQEDYFLVRKIYAPVQIQADHLNFIPGQKSNFTIDVTNRFDFISLHGYQLKWQIVNLKKTIDQGKRWLDAPANHTQKVTIQGWLPEHLTAAQPLALHLMVLDPQGKQINEKNIVLKEADFTKQIRDIKANQDLQISISKTAVLEIQNKKQQLLKSPLLMRVGRKQTITLLAQTSKNKFNWQPYLLRPKVDHFKKIKTDSGQVYLLDCHWAIDNDSLNHRGFKGVVQILIGKNNVIELSYKAQPYKGATGSLLACGLTLLLEKQYQTFDYLGQGPFSTTVGKKAYNENGLWALNIQDIRFNGNRSNVRLAAATSTDSTGIGLWSSNGNIGLENIDGRMAISQNEIVSGYGSKFKTPKGLMRASDIDEVSGKLILFITTASKPVDFLNQTFNPYKTINPENPYQSSYGW